MLRVIRWFSWFLSGNRFLVFIMSHLLTPHAVWFTVAIGAYGLGKWSVQSQSDPAAEVMVQAQGVESGLGASPSALLVRQASEESDLDGSVAGAKRTFGQGGIETIAKEAFSDPNPLKRELAFARLLEGLTPENAEEIREQLRDGSASGDQWRLFQYAWGSVDGPGALSKATEIERKDWREGAVSTALSGWASADPSKAIAWLGEMDEGERGRYQDDLVNGLADSDIGLASDYVLRMVEAGDRRGAELMGTVAGEQLRKSGAIVAASWAEKLPNGAAKGSALDRVANAYVEKDPASAAAWAEQFATADYGARVIEEVGDEWAERDPASAVSWLESLDDSAGKREGFESALGEWVRKDPTAASQYLVEMPQGELKDTAINGFVSRLAWEDPQSAITWAGTIQQAETRMEALTRAGQAYFRRDREGATEWLETSGLSEEAQKKVTEVRRDRRR